MGSPVPSLPMMVAEGAELNGLPLGYEPSELPVLHSTSSGVGLFIFHTARATSAVAARIGGRPRS